MAKSYVGAPLLEGWRPFLWGILDPPLTGAMFVCALQNKLNSNPFISLRYHLHRHHHHPVSDHTVGNSVEQQEVRASAPCRTDVCADPTPADDS